DCPIADILLQSGTCVHNHVYICNFAVLGRGPRRRLRPQMSITESRPVVTRQRPVITEHLRRGGRLFCLQAIFLPVSLSTLLRMAVHSTAIPISVLTVKNTPPAPC
ncbi:unnamed protein product, partial [Staurois parvus]